MVKAFRPIPYDKLFTVNNQQFYAYPKPPLVGCEAHLTLLQLVGKNKHFLIKIMNNELEEKQLGDAKHRFYHTIKNRMTIQHDNIIKIVSGGMQLPNLKGENDYQGHPYILLEYFESEGILSAAKKYSLEKRVDVLIQLAKAIQLLHQKQLVFRDLTGKNVLVSKQGKVKLCDHTGILWNEALRDRFFPGEACYWIPEIVAHKDIKEIPYSLASDIYSFGLLAYKVFLKFDTSMSVNEHENYKLTLFPGFYSLIKGLFSGTFEPNPKNRPTIEEAITILTAFQSSLKAFN